MFLLRAWHKNTTKRLNDFDKRLRVLEDKCNVLWQDQIVASDDIKHLKFAVEDARSGLREGDY